MPIVETHQHLSEPDVNDRTFGWGGNHIDSIIAAMDEHGIKSAMPRLSAGRRLIVQHRPLSHRSGLNRVNAWIPGRR